MYRQMICAALAALSLFASSSHAQHRTMAASATSPVPLTVDVHRHVPIAHWDANVQEGIAKFGVAAGSKERRKAASDRVTVFRPLPGCRLYDSRTGYSSALGTVGGTWSGNATRTLNAGGQCGIPSSQVRGLSVFINVYNWSHPGTGRVAMMPVGDSIIGNQVGFISSQWFWSAANIKTSSNGNFDVQILDITAELIIDVNGYYADLDTLDTDTQIDLIYTPSTGMAFEVRATAPTGDAGAIGAYANGPSGRAIVASAPSTGTAVQITGGRFSIFGSDVENSTTAAAFRHRTTLTTICASPNQQWSIVKHPSLNNNPGALLIITPVVDTTKSGVSYHDVNDNYVAEYYVGGCNADSVSTGHWYIRNLNTSMPVNRTFNVFVITQ